MSQACPDTPDDAAEIAAIIAADTNAYLARDRAAWGRCFVQDARFQSVMECGGLLVSRSFADFQRIIFDVMEAGPDASTGRHRHHDMSIEVSGDMAWARFDQTMQAPIDALDPPTLSHNLRVLSREADGWRIVFHGVWAEKARDTSSAVIEIDAKARVLWASPTATTRLDSFDGLTISNGTLRASRPEWDRDLRQAIDQAAPLLSMVPYRQVAGLTSEPIRYPVILGDDARGQRLICWVRIEDFRLYVSFGEEERMARQLASARAIFGLSDAQVRLVGLIAEGCDLSQAAHRLGISPSTTRTHLNRIFDKVGVRSQTALLRLVLSCG